MRWLLASGLVQVQPWFEPKVRSKPGPEPAQEGPVHLRVDPDHRTLRFGPVQTWVRGPPNWTADSLEVAKEEDKVCGIEASRRLSKGIVGAP